MIGLLRWLFVRSCQALCLLLLLACPAEGWVWWRGSRSGRAGVEISLLGRDVQLFSHAGGLNLQALAIVGLPSLLWLARRGRRAYVLRRRRRQGLCLRCGYDLTGNTSAICSECGEKAPAVKGVPT